MRDRRKQELELVDRAKRAMGLNDVELARLLQLSRKTVWRWRAKRSSPGSVTLGALALHVYARDPALAARIHALAAREVAESNAALPHRRPLSPPPPLPEPKPASLPEPEPEPATAQAVAAPAAAAAPTLDPRTRVEALIYAGCEACDLGPRVVRAVLSASLRRAREVGLSMEEIERALAAPSREGGRMRRGKEHRK